MPFFGKLNTFRTLKQGPWKWLILNNMFQKQLPLNLEGIFIKLLLGYFRPAFEEIDCLGNVRIPYRPRSISVRLGVALAKTCHCSSSGSIDLECKKIIAPYPDYPG